MLNPPNTGSTLDAHLAPFWTRSLSRIQASSTPPPVAEWIRRISWRECWKWQHEKKYFFCERGISAAIHLFVYSVMHETQKYQYDDISQLPADIHKPQKHSTLSRFIINCLLHHQLRVCFLSILVCWGCRVWRGWKTSFISPQLEVCCLCWVTEIDAHHSCGHLPCRQQLCQHTGTKQIFRQQHI